MTTRKRLPLALFVLPCVCGLIVSAAPLLAEDADEIEGEVTIGPQYYVDTDNRDSAKFLEYRDVPNGLVAERFLLSWTPRPGWFFDVDAIDVTQDDQRLLTEFGKVDLWHGEIRWLENPRRWTDRAFMLFTESSPGVFTLEDSLQAAVRAAPASVLPGGDSSPQDNEWDAGTKGRIIEDAILSSASAIDLRHQRETGGVMFEGTPTRNWTFDFNAERERRRGTTPQNLGAPMGASMAPAEVAAPLDFRTDTASVGAEYAARRVNFGVQLMASDFRTEHKSLTWDNQLFLIDEAVNANQASPGHGRLTFAADNELTRWSAHGGVNLPGRTRIDASFAMSETTQDDPFLPMTINSLLAPAALPAANYDGKHETTAAHLRISSRPANFFRWSAWWRSYELDNRSPELTFLDYVQADTSFPLCGNINLPCDANGNDILDDRIQRRSLPYAYKRDLLGALVGWSPARWFSGAVSYEREDVEREFAAVVDATEDIYKLALDFDVTSWLSLRSTFRRQERRADHYDVHYLEESFPIGEPYVAGFNEGSRRFYWTDRDRDAYDLQFDVTLGERWGLYGGASHYDDDYFDPETGLAIGQSFSVQEDRDFDTVPETYELLLAGRTDDRGDSYSLGFSYGAGPRLDLYADYTIEEFEYSLASRYRGIADFDPAPGAQQQYGTDDPLDNWSSEFADDYDTANVGFNWAITEDRSWKLRGDLSRSWGTGLVRTDFVPGGQSSGNTTLTVFPEVQATLELATLALTHAVSKSFEYGLVYWYESWEEDNFASDFNEPYMGDPNEDPASANSVFLGIDFENYTNHVLSFQLRARF